jgi:hypothetical protein
MIPDSAVQSGVAIKRQALRSAEGTQIMNLGSSSYYYKPKNHPDGQTCRDDDLREHRADPGRFPSYSYRAWASSFAGRGLRSTTNRLGVGQRQYHLNPRPLSHATRSRRSPGSDQIVAKALHPNEIARRSLARRTPFQSSCTHRCWRRV